MMPYFAVNDIEDRSLDFVHYDLQCKPMLNKHEEMIAQWIKKIKTGEC